MQFGTHDDALIFVHVEQSDRRSPDFSKSDDLRPHHCEMVSPYMHARIEERHNLVRVGRNRRQVSSFLGIAIGASFREIQWIIVTLMLPRSDMLDVKRDVRRGVLGQVTVFAAMARSPADQFADRFIHLGFGLLREEFSRPALQNGDDMKGRAELLVIRTFFVGQRPVVRFFSQRVDPGLRFGVGSQRHDFPRRIRRQAFGKWTQDLL
ncbi:MAG TPA: hypothetical protein VND64_30185 [Pirellulales bacterium]|nr:hypothetical protein [Pirellulales bacterium]